jgi:hypothetical protein
MPDIRQQVVWRFDGRTAALRVGVLSATVDPARPGAGLHDVRVDQCDLVGVSLLGARLAPDSAKGPVSDSSRVTLRESYVRGLDFIATYPQTPGSIAAEQMYWRAIVPDGESPVCGVEVIASLQTDLLDSHPSFHSTTAIDAIAVCRLGAPESDRFSPIALSNNLPVTCAPETGPGVFLVRLAECDYSYVEMIHPGDFRGTTISATAATAAASPRTNEPPQSRAKSDDAVRRVTLTSILFPERLEKGVIRRGRLAGIFVPRERDEQAAAHFYRQWIASPPPLTA